ncbi:pre-peptidase C-terminal domain-containing protein, partial [Candidatus Bipolaricaulota bacterium]
MRTTTAIVLLLLLSSAAAFPDDHGNTPFAATPIAADGGLTTACIENAGDMDYFLFDATAGRTYRVETSHPTDGMDSLLYLIARDGQEILAVDDSSGGGTNARIVWTCPKTGIYFLMVRHAQATLGTGCYGLSASVSLLDDHGDDVLGATPIASGYTVAGFLEEAGDVDVFVLQIDPGYEYSVEFAAPNVAAPLALTATRNGSSEPLLSLTSQGTAEQGVMTSPVADSVFVSVSAPDSAATGSYALTVERGGYADDHGNSAIDATPLSIQWVEIIGRLEVPGDVDWFSWEARQDAEYTFLASSPDGTSGVRATIRGADAQLLHESATGVLSEPVEIVWRAPQSGTYYLEISSSNGTGSYRLDASATLQLETVGSLNPSGYSLDVEVQDDHVFLIVGTKGLLIIDVEDPSSPFEIGSHSTNGYAQAIALDDDVAFVANRSEGITSLDISDPSRPAQLGTLDTPGSAQ